MDIAHLQSPAEATAANTSRADALKVARQFEEVLMRTLVATMRQSAELDGEEGGMFGSGPGSDTFADWFDEHMSRSLADGDGVGITDVLMREFERSKQIPAAPPPAKVPSALPQQLYGGFDVTG